MHDEHITESLGVEFYDGMKLIAHKTFGKELWFGGVVVEMDRKDRLSKEDLVSYKVSGTRPGEPFMSIVSEDSRVWFERSGVPIAPSEEVLPFLDSLTAKLSML